MNEALAIVHSVSITHVDEDCNSELKRRHILPSESDIKWLVAESSGPTSSPFGNSDTCLEECSNVKVGHRSLSCNHEELKNQQHSEENLEHDFEEDEYGLPREIRLMACRVLLQAENLRKVWLRGWRNVAHHALPIWLKDNDKLLNGHRPQLNSFCACFKSVFRIHTETGNIWTHLLGCVSFFGIAVYFFTRPSIEVQWQEKLVFSVFFISAILCLAFSTLFHTVHCHSERVGRVFVKLDYCGIALLTMGSFVPWLYYTFYCQVYTRSFYLGLIVLLGFVAIMVSMWDKFAGPRYRPLRAGVFIALGLSGVVPAVHFVILEGLWRAIYFGSMGWLILMAVLYITGALIYAFRFPELFFPGKFDLWFQSHQIFHVFVVIAALVHYHGISELSNYRLTQGACPSFFT